MGTASLVWSRVMRSAILDTNFSAWPFTIVRLGALGVAVKSYGALVTSCAGDGSCEAFHPPPSASINPALAVIC